MSTGTPERANFLAYHQSLTDELQAVKDRVRNLINHWATDGAFKEAALRNVLRRHLPETMQVGTGFIVNKRGECSTQIDLLIIDRNHPTLFKDGDLFIVSPSAVRAVIEVKTTLSGPQAFREALGKLADCKLLCQDWFGASRIFTGLFVYDASANQSRNIVEAVKFIFVGHRGWINAVSYGPDIFGLFHQSSRLPNGVDVSKSWSVWQAPRLAPAYFLGSILNNLSEHEIIFNPTTWFPGQSGNIPLCYLDPLSKDICDYVPPVPDP